MVPLCHLNRVHDNRILNIPVISIHVGDDVGKLGNAYVHADIMMKIAAQRVLRLFAVRYFAAGQLELAQYGNTSVRSPEQQCFVTLPYDGTDSDSLVHRFLFYLFTSQ